MFGAVNNPCQLNNGGCSYLCLLSSTSNVGYSCVGADDVEMSHDNRMCVGKVHRSSALVKVHK